MNVRIPDLCNGHQPIDFREILQAFTLDVIGKCAYNVEFGALQEDRLHKPKILNDLQGYIDSQNVVPDAFTSAMYLMILAEPKLSIWLEAYPKVAGTLRQFVIHFSHTKTILLFSFLCRKCLNVSMKESCVVIATNHNSFDTMKQI